MGAGLNLTSWDEGDAVHRHIGLQYMQSICSARRSSSFIFTHPWYVDLCHTSVIKISSLWHHYATADCRERETAICYLSVNAILSPPHSSLCYSMTIKTRQLTCSVTPHWEGLLDWSWTSEGANEFKRDEGVAGEPDMLCSMETVHILSVK